jgi:hypothetical protein
MHALGTNLGVLLQAAFASLLDDLAAAVAALDGGCGGEEQGRARTSRMSSSSNLSAPPP